MPQGHAVITAGYENFIHFHIFPRILYIINSMVILLELQGFFNLLKNTVGHYNEDCGKTGDQEDGVVLAIEM